MIRNLVNDKRYFGISDNYHSRLSGHRSGLRRGDHTNSQLKQEWNAFGEHAFEFSVVDVFEDRRSAALHESELIERYQTNDSRFGYNIMMRGRWSTAARLRNTEKKLIAKHKYSLLPGVKLEDEMAPVFVRSAKKGHHD